MNKVEHVEKHSTYRETIFKLSKDYHLLTPADQERLLKHIMEWVHSERRRITDEFLSN